MSSGAAAEQAMYAAAEQLSTLLLQLQESRTTLLSKGGEETAPQGAEQPIKLQHSVQSKKASITDHSCANPIDHDPGTAVANFFLLQPYLCTA